MKKMFRTEVGRLCAIAAPTLAAMLLSAGAQAATYYVTPTGAGVGDGKSWGSATGSIQLAIDSCAANGGGEVWLKAGTYKPAATLRWKVGVDVYGGFAGTETDKQQRSLDATLTVLDGDGAKLIAQGATGYAQQTTWSGLTLQNGNSTYSGGIFLYPNMTLDNVVISSCAATSTGNYGGGGIFIAAVAETDDAVIVRSCLIVGNTANFGGGICVGYPNNTDNPIRSHVLIENTQIINNRASNRGGGIAIEPKVGSTKNVVIRNSVIANNSSGSNAGGGISLFRADAQLINTTFARNISGNWGGGGLYANNVDSLTVLGCIFWNNEDAQNGTGSHAILSAGKGAVDSVVIIRNSAFGPALQVGTDVPSSATLADNIAVDVENSGSAPDVKYINFSRPSAAAGYAAGDADKIAASWSLAQGSAAIDAGAAVAGVAADIVGRSRPVGDRPDIGAYEYAAPITIAAGAAVATGYTATSGDVIFEATATTGAGQWTAANAAVTNGAVKLVRTFETNRSYAIGFPFAVASVSAAGYELKYYDGETNLFGAAAAIEAGKGYLIKFPAPKDTVVTVTFASVRNPTLVTPAALGASEYAIVANPTLKDAAGVAGAQHYYPLGSATGAFGAPVTSLAGGLKPFEAVLATAATASLLAADAIGKGNAAAPSVTLTADSGISVLTPENVAYPYLTIDPFVATFNVAAGYTNVRAIVAVDGAAKPDTISLSPAAGVYTVALGAPASPTLIRLAADTIRSTLTINAGEGVGEVSLTSGVKVGYFDNVWFTFKTRDGYHSPKVTLGSAYKEVKKGAGGVDTVFLSGVTANATVNIVAFRNNTAPVLYDIQVNQAGTATPAGTTLQILLQAANYSYDYLKFDIKDAVQGSNFDKITLRLQMSANGTVQAAKKLLLQWVSNNSNGGDENTDGTTPWDNSFTYAGRPVSIKDTVSMISVGTGPGILAATAIEFTIDDPATIAQIKDSIAAGNTELSFRINSRADNIVIIAFVYSSEGSTGDLLNRTPKLIFSNPKYSIVVRNDARSSGLIALSSPSASDTTFEVAHDSSLVLAFTVKKGYEPVVKGYGKLTGAPSATGDAAYTLAIDKARADDTIRLSADVIRFDVAVAAPNGHVTVIEPATGSSPYKVANDSSFTLSFKVDAEYIPSATVSSNPSYTLGDAAPDGSYTITLPQVTSNVTITIAADLSDSVTVSLTKHDSVAITSPALTSAAAYKVARDSSFTLAFTVAEGYDVSAVTVNGVDRKDDYLTAGQGGEYTFTLPQLTASVSVAVEVDVRQYGVVLIAEEGVSIVSPAGASPHAVAHGSSLEVRVALAEGYFPPVQLVRLNGSVVSASASGGEYVATISGVTANDTVRITADNGIRRITIRKDAQVALVSVNGVATGAADTVQEARYLQPFEVTFTAPAGYTPAVTLQDGGRITTLPDANAANTYSSEISSVNGNATIIIALTAATGIADVDPNDPVVSVTYYNLQGQEVRQPAVTGVYILRRQHLSKRITVEKRLVKVD